MSAYSGLCCSCSAGPRNGRHPMETLSGNRLRRRTSQRPPDPRTTSRGSSNAEGYLLISPGYSMKRCKDYIDVRLEDPRFGRGSPPEDGHRSLTSRPVIPGRSQKPQKAERPRMRDDIVEDLQDQIAKLTALLEQEVAEHRDTQRRMSREMAEKVTELEAAKQEEIRILQEKHADEIRAIQWEDSAKLAQQSNEAAKQYEELQKEIDFLKGSFKTYQESLAEEVEAVWRQREVRWKETFEEQKMMEMSQQRHSLLDAFEVEKKAMQRRALEEQRLIQQSHEAQAEEAWKKYKEAAKEVKTLKTHKAHLQAEIASKQDALLALTAELQQVRAETDRLKNQVDKMEKNFDQNVSSAESAFQSRIQSLMMENADLRRKLIAKTEQLFNQRNRRSPRSTADVRGGR